MRILGQIRAEIGIDDPGIGRDARGGLPRSPTLAEDDHPVADLLDNVHVVLDEDDRAAIVISQTL